MNSEKPVYLMAGGRGGRSADAILAAIFRDIGKDSPSIAYVGAASGDDRQFFRMMSGMLVRGTGSRVDQVMLCSPGADLNKAKNILQSSDAVFMSGGDVEAGMTILREKGLIEFFLDLFRQGKLFFGASAGSIMLARKWVRWRDPDDDATAELFPCLGIAPVVCDTHAEEDDWEELKAALSLEEGPVRGYGIPSGTALKVYPGGRLEALAGPVVQFESRQGSTERRPDLLPA